MEARYRSVGVRVARAATTLLSAFARLSIPHPARRHLSNRAVRFVRCAGAGAVLVITAACGPGHSVLRPSTPVATPVPLALTVVNQTPCIIHVRFDNGLDSGRVPPGETKQFPDARLADYRFVQIESTMALFRTFELAPLREAGYSLTVTPALDDHPCFEEPPK